MVEAEAMVQNETDMDAVVTRIYEIGYHISPAVKEDEIEKVVSSIRSLIEKGGGSFIAEGAPTLTKLAYPITTTEGSKRVEYDRGYFGWIKFETAVASAEQLAASMKGDANLLRFIVFQTVREDTRAKIKMGTLREVKRTDTIKVAPRRAEETAAPVSEEELEKALSEITAE